LKVKTTLKTIIRRPSSFFGPSKDDRREDLRLKNADYANNVLREFFKTHPDGLIRVEDFYMYLHKKSSHLSATVIKRGTWEPKTTQLFRKLLPNTKTFVDVGANIGWYTLLSAKRAKKVWAFEPESENFDLLEKSVKRNGLTNVVLSQKCLSDSEGMITLWLADDSANWHSTVRKRGSNSVEVPCTTLDSVFPNQSIDLLKIDVEGAESQVLLGAKKLIHDGRAKNIILDWKPEFWKVSGDLLDRYESFEIDGRAPFRFKQPGNLYLKLLRS
jgi:FkbM family methyltransferase